MKLDLEDRRRIEAAAKKAGLKSQPDQDPDKIWRWRCARPIQDGLWWTTPFLAGGTRMSVYFLAARLMRVKLKGAKE